MTPRRPRRSPPERVGYWTHWTLLQLPTEPRVYAQALTYAIAASGTATSAHEIVHSDVVPEVVVVWMVLDADDLGSAISRALQRVIWLMDCVGVRQPGRIEFLAGRLGQPPPVDDQSDGLFGA